MSSRLLGRGAPGNGSRLPVGGGASAAANTGCSYAASASAGNAVPNFGSVDPDFVADNVDENAGVRRGSRARKQKRGSLAEIDSADDDFGPGRADGCLTAVNALSVAAEVSSEGVEEINAELGFVVGNGVIKKRKRRRSAAKLAAEKAALKAEVAEVRAAAAAVVAASAQSAAADAHLRQVRASKAVRSKRSLFKAVVFEHDSDNKWSCKLCTATITQSCKGTGDLIKHVVRMHSSFYARLVAPKNSERDNLDAMAFAHSEVARAVSKRATSGVQKMKQASMNAFVRKSVVDGQVDESQLRQLVTVLWCEIGAISYDMLNHPFAASVLRVKPFSRRHITSMLLPALSAFSVNVTLEKFKSAHTLAITADGWTSIHQQVKYAAVTAHFLTDSWELVSDVIGMIPLESRSTSNALSDYVKHDLFEISPSLQSHVTSIVTDNGADFSGMARILLANEDDAHHCTAHTLELVIGDALQAVHSLRVIVDVARNVIKATRTHNDIRAKLKSMKLRKIPLDVPTRWWSTFEMLRRFYFQRDALRCAWSSDEATGWVDHPSLPSAMHDFPVLGEAVFLLRLFARAVRQSEGHQYVTLSHVPEWIFQIRSMLLANHVETPIANAFQRALLASLDERFRDVLSNPRNICLAAAALHPQHAHLTIVEPSVADEVYKNLWTRYSMRIPESQQMDQLMFDGAVQTGRKFAAELGKEDEIHRARRREAMLADLPRDTIKSADIGPKIEVIDACKWWKNATSSDSKLPARVKTSCEILAPLARSILSQPATSAPSERVFSVAEHVDRYNRASMTDDVFAAHVVVTSRARSWTNDIVAKASEYAEKQNRKTKLKCSAGDDLNVQHASKYYERATMDVLGEVLKSVSARLSKERGAGGVDEGAGRGRSHSGSESNSSSSSDHDAERSGSSSISRSIWSSSDSGSDSGSGGGDSF